MSGSVSLIDGHIDGADRCVSCGRDIPEGYQYCIICGAKKRVPKRQIDRIREMGVEELAEFLYGTTTSIAIKLNGVYVSNEIEYIKQYLESEVDTE